MRCSFCLDEIKRLDCGRWFGSEFKNIKIHTLEEILQKFKNIAHFQIELKDNNNLLPEIVLDYLQKNDWYKSNFIDPYQVPGFSITSFHIKQILRTKKIDNKVIVGWLLEVNKKINKELFEYCKTEDINMIIPQVNSISEEDISLIDEIKKSRITLCAWGARNLEEVKKMSILGIDAMTVDWPDKALKVI